MPVDLPNLTFDFPSAQVLAADAEFWELYDGSFPASEREPQSVILETLNSWVGLVIRSRAGDRTVGFSAAHLLHEPAVLFVVYLAVAPNLRSRHIGAGLFEKTWTVGAKRYADRGLRAAGMVWEVDIPERALSEEDLQLRRRRIAFFERLGGYILPRRYVQPPVHGTEVPMHLMFRPDPDRSLPDDSFLSALVRALYFEKYHEANKIPRPVLDGLLCKTGN